MITGTTASANYIVERGKKYSFASGFVIYSNGHHTYSTNLVYIVTEYIVTTVHLVLISITYFQNMLNSSCEKMN